MTRRFCTGSPNFGHETQACCELHDNELLANNPGDRENDEWKYCTTTA